MDKAKLTMVAAAYTEASAKVAASKPTKTGATNRTAIVGAARSLRTKLAAAGISEARAYKLSQTWENTARLAACQREGKATA